MAGIADLYQKDESTASRDRLLSARSGVSNILANAHKDAGWAAPGIAILQGQEAQRIGTENEASTKRQEFLGTFGKLLSANGGAAAKFWTEHAKDVGIDAELESIDAKPNETIVSFKNGIIANIDKKNGTITTPDGQGGFRPWTDEDTAKFEGYAKKELDNKGAKPSNEKDKNLRDIRGRITTLTANLSTQGYANDPKVKAQVDSEIASLKAQYKTISGQEYDTTVAATPPAPPSVPVAAPKAPGLMDVVKGWLPGSGPAAAAPAPAAPPASAQKVLRYNPVTKKLE